MSDFDKEAERERLREKYESEDDGRESTRRMSELLLKGATMTDHHCDECGDPIFRYDGQAFCPTCQGGGEGAAASAAGGAATGEDGAGETPASGDASTTESDVEVGTPTDAVDRGAPAREPGARGGDAAVPDATGATDARAEAGAGAGAGSGDDRATARASLERTLARFAGEAEAADDPRHARAMLAAAREAAEALAALDRR